MQIQPQAHPQPFPKLPPAPAGPALPQDWKTSDLVRIVTLDGSRQSSSSFAAAAIVPQGRSGMFVPKFTELRTRDLGQALAAARELSQAVGLIGHGGPTAAIAVLQSETGAYYATALTRSGAYATLTPSGTTVPHDVTALHPAVKAVVGSDRYVDLSASAS